MFNSAELQFLHQMFLSVNYPPDGINGPRLASKLARATRRAEQWEACQSEGAHEFIAYPAEHAQSGSCVKCGRFQGHLYHQLASVRNTIRSLDTCVDSAGLLGLPEIKTRFENLRSEFLDIMSSQLAELTRRDHGK